MRRCSDRYDDLMQALNNYQVENGPLPGLRLVGSTETLVRQMIASLRRTEYIRVLGARAHSQHRLNPHNSMFDPLTAALMFRNQGRMDEAVWLVFLATQFGKHSQDGWKLCANIYGSFGKGPIWTAERYHHQTDDFVRMLVENARNLADPRIAGRYSNHRQYVSRRPNSIARTFEEASTWLYEGGSFAEKIRAVHRGRGQNPSEVFDGLYHSMRSVHSFGRLGSFDFLTMLGKLELAPITPGSTYLIGATGPLRGARLLFFGATDHPASGRALQARFDHLDDFLRIGKQPLEDSICNWQKSPQNFVHFRG